MLGQLLSVRLTNQTGWSSRARYMAPLTPLRAAAPQLLVVNKALTSSKLDLKLFDVNGLQLARLFRLGLLMQQLEG